MAEEYARQKQYAYKANSNLVLEAERENRRGPDESTGEVESLWGRLSSQRMGDKVKSQVPSELLADKKRKFADTGEERRSKKASFEGDAVESGSYIPRTRESRRAFEEMLQETARALGQVPDEVLRDATEEVLYLLKDERTNSMERLKQISRLLGRKENDDALVSRLDAISQRITDLTDHDSSEYGQALDEDMGVAVVFEDEDEDEDEAVAALGEDDENDQADNEASAASALGMQLDDHDLSNQEEDAFMIDVRTIDAHWLQRELSKYYEDANLSAALAKDVLKLLGGDDAREIENKLVMLLDYDKFDLIRLLMKNRKRILFATLLKQAETDEERTLLQERIQADEEGPAILTALHETARAETWARDRAADLASRTRREAAGLAKNFNLDQKNETDLVKPVVTSRRIVDLSSLVFAAKGHTMSNKRCELPSSAWRAQKQGYEEVHVPALEKAASQNNQKLVSIQSLPAWIQPAFAGMNTLNTIQSALLPAAFERTENLLLCAPTGAGKTNCAVLAMLNQCAAYRLEPHDESSIKLDLDAFKIVYIAPMKALVQEVVLNFSKRLSPYGITVRELSGDASLTYAQIQETQVIVSTPEKWDIITRKAGDRAYTRLVRLVIIDEIHLLHDDRGSVLEALVARIIRGVEESRDNVRLIGLSATLPNYQDVAAFLRVNPESGLFFFDNSYRPVPLQQQYVGISEKKAVKRFQLMNQICFEKVLARAGKQQVLIFVHSRADTAKTAMALRDAFLETDGGINLLVRPDSATREILQEEATSAKSDALRELLPYGLAIHHAGMTRADRNLVEDLFADRHVQVLCATSTLAWGVNLPAHTVIIKGTQCYSPDQGKWVELSPLDVVQMMGRAGRPQFDSDGEGIILTKHSELQFYLSLMNQQLPVESQLASSIPNHLNAEIEMGTIQNLKQAAQWLTYTYWHVRAYREPLKYGALFNTMSDEDLESHELDIVHSAALVLDEHNLIKYDTKNGSLQITALGRVAAHFYVSYESIAAYNAQLKPNMSDIELFRLFAGSGEFGQIRVREEEKLEVAKLITRVPIPIKEAPEEPAAKINALLQAYISNLSLEGFALVADMTYVRQSAARLCRALFEMALRRKWAALALKTLTLCKMVERKLWQSQSALRQFKGVPEAIVRKLEKKDITWDRFYDLKPQDLAELVKLPKMGKTLHRLVHQVPRLELAAHVQPVSRGLLKIELIIIPDFQFDPKVHDHALLFHVMVEDVDGERILHHEPFILRSTYALEEHVLEFFVPVADPLPPQYFIRVTSDRWLHSTAVLPVSFKHLILPRKFSPHTELLDLQPLPLSALDDSRLEKLFADDVQNGTHFNPVQTQCFSAMYETDDNILLCASSAAGRIVCSEFAMLRALSNNSNPDETCIVYVAAKQASVTRRRLDWQQKFGQLGLARVAELSGEVSADLQTLATTPIVLATAQKWDVISRRWKQRKAVQKVKLFIADELQCLGSAVEGPALEVVISRMRYLSSQLDESPRLVGLGAAIANAADLGDWIGATRPGTNCFSFHSSVRPSPLELLLHTFDTSHYSARLLAMARLVFQLFKRHDAGSRERPALIFVSSRKQCQLTAIDAMVHFATFDDDSDSMYTAEIEEVYDPALRQTLARGVAFRHAGIRASDRRIIDSLYVRSALRVLVVPAEACWDIKVSAPLVVIMGTERYDGRQHRYLDYSAPDILEMLAKADAYGEAKCAVLCHSPKKEYLKRLLYDPLPVESHLDRALHDHLNAEIVAKTVESKQDAVDYLTWSFFYRRLTQNPNFYDLHGVTHRHVSDHLSELIENVVSDLSESRCIAIDNDIDLSPLNLGMIAAYYSIQYTTIELFASSVTAKSKITSLLEILASAAEYSTLPTRLGEEHALEKIASHLPRFKPPLTENDDKISKDELFSRANVKVLVLLHSHFARQPLSSELAADRDSVVRNAPRLLQALVDVISSHGWLAPALHAMELSQMIVQGLWISDHPLLQVPYLDDSVVDRIQIEVRQNPDIGDIAGVLDLLSLEDDVRDRVLAQPDPNKLATIAAFCNDYPNIELAFEPPTSQLQPGEPTSITVTLEREVDEDMTDIGRVRGLFPGPKKEGWWLIVADLSANSVLSIKRVSIMQQSEVSLDFLVPDLLLTESEQASSARTLTLYFMSDSYLGCDQEYEFTIRILENGVQLE